MEGQQNNVELKMRKLYMTAKTEGTLVSLPELQVDKHVKYSRSRNICVKNFHVLIRVVLSHQNTSLCFSNFLEKPHAAAAAPC